MSVSSTQRFSDVEHSLIYQKMKSLSLMVRLDHASILKTHKNSSVIDVGFKR